MATSDVKRAKQIAKKFDELEFITKKLYEDNALSKITDDKYARLYAQFTYERIQANERLTSIAEQQKKEERNLESIVNFTAIIEKYLDIKELNKTVLNELIDKIEVHEAKKIDGKCVQKVDIYYRFIGTIN